MIFKQWQQVLDGTKTQTRRPVRENGEFYEQAKRNTFGFVHLDSVITQGRAFGIQGSMVKWQVGRTYAVQPRMSKKAVGRIRLTAIRREALEDITEADIVAEGISGTIKDGKRLDLWLQWVNLWDSIYAKTEFAWRHNPDVWVLTFELVEMNVSLGNRSVLLP